MPRIFISYRREDSSPYAGRIYDQLVQRFGDERVFMDIDSMEPGVDFVDTLQKTVASCNIFLAVIGKQWLAVQEEQGGRRLMNPNDFVSLEISAVLEMQSVR